MQTTQATIERRARFAATWLRWLWTVCAIGTTGSIAASAPPDQARVALVIGNAAYAAVSPLFNSSKDAQALSAVLKEKGFQVIHLENASRARMLEGIDEMRRALDGRRGIGVLYFAGHGLQLDWRNYMLPVDVRLATSDDVPKQAIDVQHVIDAFKQAGTRVNIVVLDACRNNPFGPLASGKGLAPMDAPSGTLLAYSTAPGNVAEDGDDREENGTYAEFLLRELRAAPASIEDIFKRVRLQVRRKTEGRQIPWESTSLEEDFYFDARAQARKLAVEEDARQGALELQEWNRIKDSKQAADFTDYVLKFPSGRYVELAQFRLDQLQERRVENVPRRDGIVPVDPNVTSLRKGDVYVYDQYENFTFKRRLPQLRFEVSDVSTERVLINDGTFELDHAGTLYKAGDDEYSPGYARYTADLAIGKKWRTDFAIVRRGAVLGQVTWNFRVAAIERIKVPAGSFMTYRIEGSGYNDIGGGNYLKRTAWVDVKPPLTTIKEELLFRSSSGNYVHTNTVRELASVKPGPQ